LVSALVNLRNRHGILSRPRCPSLNIFVHKGSVFMFIAAAAPNKRSLGATNGLAQTVVPFQRTFGPGAAASLFAFSLANGVLSGNFVNVVLLAFVWVAPGVAAQPPRHTWKHGMASNPAV
ncbi:hypothetical protein BGW80DRAFT_1341684, partial [Lactifluus volemus]